MQLKQQWRISSITEKDDQEVFQEVARIVEQNFEELIFCLTTSKEDCEAVVQRDDEKNFKEMQDFFFQEMKRDVTLYQTREFVITIEPVMGQKIGVSQT